MEKYNLKILVFDEMSLRLINNYEKMEMVYISSNVWMVLITQVVPGVFRKERISMHRD